MKETDEGKEIYKIPKYESDGMLVVHQKRKIDSLQAALAEKERNLNEVMKAFTHERESRQIAEKRIEELEAYDSTLGGMTKDVNDLQSTLNSLQRDHGEELAERKKAYIETCHNYAREQLSLHGIIAARDKRIEELREHRSNLQAQLVAAREWETIADCRGGKLERLSAKLKATEAVVEALEADSKTWHHNLDYVHRLERRVKELEKK